MAKTKTISVTFRCPEDLHNALSNFALDHNIIKDDKPIISEALIAALRIGLGTDSNTDVSQSVRQPDFEAMITEAINSRLIIIESKVQNLQSDRTSEKTAALLIETLQTNLAIANHRIDDLSAKIAALSSEAIAPANFTQAILQRVKEVAPDVIESSVEPVALPIIEAIANIAAPTMENLLPDETLSDAIAATAKPKSTKRSAKSKYTRDELEKLKNTDIRKIYRAEIPVADRALNPNYASKADMIDAILTAKTHT